MSPTRASVNVTPQINGINTMNSLILLASISLHVGDCWRETKYAGLSRDYGQAIKILEIGEKSVVFTAWSRTIQDWGSHFIEDKQSLEGQLEKHFEKITCPARSN
jgi:hypothetical protein